MHRAKKIYVNKSEEAALVIERVMDAEAEALVLSIPKFSKFGQSESNFHLLKKEADALGKAISIESVDERVLELAANSDLPASNPFFANPDRQFSDIIPKSGGAPESKTVFVKTRVAPQAKHEVQEEMVESPENIGAEIEAQFGPEPRRPRSWRVSLAIFSVLVLAGGLSFLALRVLPKAEIRLVAEKKQFAYANVIGVDKAIRENDVVAMKIPGQIFSEKKNVTLTFPASGKKYVSKKAAGKITIYNGYSSEPQKLVASTRLISPDGKIFRLASSIVVPGAKIVDGAIVPSSIETTVVADQPGEAYNIPATPRFEIPGFKGTARYGAFYGQSAMPMAGGYVGEQAYPTEEDIKKGKIEIAKVLENGARGALQSKIPSDFKMVENAFTFSIVRQTVNPDADEGGHFSIFAEAELALMAFRDADMSALFKERSVRETGNDYSVKDDNLTFGTSRVDMAAGKMAVTVDYKATLAKNVDVENLKPQMLRKSGAELRAMLLAVTGLESARVELWPFWVGHVPGRSDKVNIIVE
jgi:hypothetical protein